MDRTKDEDNAAGEGKGTDIPFGLVAIFLAALVAGFVVASPGLNLFGSNNANYCGGYAKQNYALQQNNAAELAAGAPSVADNQSSNSSEEVQEIRMTVDANGWTPNSFVLKKGVKVRWIIDGKAVYPCNGEIIGKDLGLDVKLKTGENVIEFTPNETGVFRWNCPMNMLHGTFIVVNDPNNQSEVQNATANVAATQPKSNTGCGCGMMQGGSCGR